MRRMLIISIMIVVASVAMSGRGPSLTHVLHLGTSVVTSSNDTQQRQGEVLGAEVVPSVPATTPHAAQLPANPERLHRWTEFPVHYCIDVTQTGPFAIDELQRLAELAFASWGVPVLDDGPCPHPQSRGDDLNEIGWGRPPGAPPPGSRLTEAGLTLSAYTQCTANCRDADAVRLTESDIIITKDVPDEFNSERCVYSTLLHETGHFLGLEHLPAPAVMQAQTSSCMTRLAPADIAALVARYGDFASPKPDLFGG